jgi:hypothetical protein
VKTASLSIQKSAATVGLFGLSFFFLVFTESCELEKEIRQLPRGKEKGRRKEGILSNFPQTYLDSKGMGHATSFLLFLRP